MRLVLHRAAHPHGPEKAHPAHAYYACEPATGELAQLTDELGTVAPSVSPDGSWLYYIIDETALG